MDILLAGEDQSQADKPNSLAEGPPVPQCFRSAALVGGYSDVTLSCFAGHALSRVSFSNLIQPTLHSCFVVEGTCGSLELTSVPSVKNEKIISQKDCINLESVPLLASQQWYSVPLDYTQAR
eukprot:1159789-Pelagomonas_calceolata.AAC.4